MKRWVLAVSASFALAAAGVPAALAQDIEPEEEAHQQAREARKDRSAERFCIEETGSRIVASRNARSADERKECVDAGGRVYTREDIERSGSTDLADALRRLDPSIR